MVGWYSLCVNKSNTGILAGGLDQLIHRGPFQPLPLCDSVNYNA